MKNQVHDAAYWQRKFEESEAKKNQLETSLSIINRKLIKEENKSNELKLKNDKTEKEILKLRVFLAGLDESFKVEKMYNWAKKSEKFSASDLAGLKTLLFRNRVKKEDIADQDVGEAGAQCNNCSVTSEDIPFGLSEDDLSSKKLPKRRGRQYDVVTCGRDNSVFSSLDFIEHTVDDKAQLERDNPNLKFNYVRTETSLQLDYIESHNITRKVITSIYRDQYGTLHEYQYNNPKMFDFIKSGKLTNRLIASAITDKVIYGQPLHLQVNKMNLIAQNQIINDQLLGSNFIKIGERLSFFAELIRTKILEQTCFHADETRIPIVEYSNKTKPGSKLGYMWSLSCNTKELQAVYFTFNISRGTAVASKMIEGAKFGGLQVDGYSAYVSAVRLENEKIAKEIAEDLGTDASEKFCNDVISADLKNIVVVGCLAHGRRKFTELQNSIYKNKPKSPGAITCGGVMALIIKIYKWENSLREKYNKGIYSEDVFIEKRKEKTLPLLNELLNYSKKRINLHENDRKIYKALNYLINQHSKIINYLDYSALTPDNNFQERQFRSSIIRTRNNSLFASNERGAKAWGVNSTLAQCAQMNHINPTHYIKYLMDEIGASLDKPSKDFDYNRLLPWIVDYKVVSEAWSR